ncbi:MAG: InlB B-repeat-containing protein [Paludibacteraceae bacterium]|nr:InlB B-repeat-containing protein [Paludibacteraceae bacterium]
MKKHRLLTLLCSLLFAFSSSAFAAVTYCAPSAFGYGASATGGGSATPVLVSSVSELQSALNKGKNKVIIITANLTFTSMLTVQDGSNVTVLGLPGVTLTSLQQDASSSGILYVKRFSNLIIRNLTFVGPGAYDCDGNDLLCFQDVTNAWVDHCDFQDGCDGNFDNKNGTDNVTVSWCRFRYLKAPRARECDLSTEACQKLTDDHRFTNLLGSGSSDAPSDGTYNMTWAYCWWDSGCRERMLRCRNASLHFLNCYWNSSVANYYIGPENADCYVEGCTFEGNPATNKIFYQNYGGTNGVKFINSTATKGLPSNVSNRTVVTPPYSYTASTAAEAKTAITNASCGAGATLTVTTSGVVSSSCDGSAPTMVTITWDATTNGGTCSPTSSLVASGSAIGSLPTANRSGYTFNGWFTSASGGTQINASTTVSANTTYYAQFTESGSGGGGGSCSGTIYSAVTSATGNISIAASTSNLALNTSTHNTTVTGGSISVYNGQTEAKNLITSNGYCITNNNTYFRIDLDCPLQDGDVISVDVGKNADERGVWITTATSRPSSAPACALTETGTGTALKTVTYTVTGSDAYYGNSTFYIYRATANSTYFNNINITRAGSTPPPATNYVLSYDENGGSGTMADVEQTGSSVTIAANAFTAPTGYSFLKWNSSMGGSGTDYAVGASITLTADLTIYAIWQPNNYTVTLDAGSGTGGTTSVTATFNAAMPDITIPTRDGYTFLGYYTGADGTGTQYYDAAGHSTNAWTIAAPTTLRAAWELSSTPEPTGNEFTITYNANGGSVTPSSQTQATEGASITLPTPTRTDYTFLGWYVGATKIGNGGASYTPTANMTAIAAWKQDCAGGGGPTTLADINFKDASWTGKTFSQGNTTTSDVHNGIYFYSKNSDAAKQFSLTDNTTNGLTFPNNNISSGNYYFCIPLESGEIDGSITVTLKHGYSSNKASYKYVFVDGRESYVSGNTNGSGGTQVTDANNSDTEITFTVSASNANHKGHLIIGRQSSSYTQLYGVTVITGSAGSTCYYVTYDGNGADGGYTNDPTAYSNNAEVTVLANSFTKTGYVFQGWAETTAHRDAGTVDYASGSKFTITADKTLYAVWAMPCATPAAPTAFATTAVAGSSATFAITDAADAASYDLYYASGSPTTPTAGTAATETVTTKTPTITGLTAATTYYAWVRAVCDADHKSSWVALTGSSFTTTKLAPNSYNVGAAAEGECAGGMTAKITLSGSQTGVDYQLKKDGVDDGAAKAGTGSALEWTGKGSGVYTVWAVENATYSGLQMNKTATVVVYATTAITTQPALSVPAEINESFTLGSGMVAAGNELAYRWYTCGSTGTDTVFIPGAINATYSASQSALDTYYYRVRVEGTCGEPVLSNIITVTVTSEVPPSDAPTISVQPSGDTYCAGDVVSALSITASGSGTLTYQWRKDGVDISGATSATYLPSEAGTYTCVVTNTEDGKIAVSLVSDGAVVAINPAVATPVITQTDNTVNLATATAGATIYYTTDGSDPTTGSASGTSVSIVTDCTVKAYAVKDGCESAIESFAATFDPTVKECAVLITYTLSGSGTATPTIPADENNLVGGTADYNVGSNSISGGYKLESNQYFGLTLASGQFKAGDKVTVTITKASDQGDLGLYLSASKTGAAVASIAAGDVVVGDNVFTLTSDCDAIYVARNSNVNQNPFVKSISVCRTLTKYAVTFDKNNVSATGTMEPQSFYDGFAAKLKANSFSLTDYMFAGWATDASGSKVYDDQESVTMTGDITLYALWEPAKYTLTNAVSPAGYGSVDVASVGNITPGTTTTSSANTYTVNGTTVTATPAATTAEYTYAFDSWSGLPATVTENATVTANFTRTPRNYSVTLHTNDGTINSGNVTGYTFGTGATLPTDITKDDSEFKGWYDNSSFTGSAVTEISASETGDKEYWAKWIVCPAMNSGETIYRFDVNSNVSDGNICSSGNNPVQLTKPTQLSTLIGGTLEGWISNNSSWNNLAFSSGRITYNNGDKGVLVITLDCPIQEGDLIRFNNYSSSNSKYNYLRHTSYSTEDNQLTLNASKTTTEIQSVVAPAAFAGKTELYIISGARTTGISYFEIIRSCPIILDANTNGGKVGGENSKTLRAAMGDEVVLPHAVKEGYFFKGWFTAPSGGSAVSNPYTVAGPATLYAQFEDCPNEGILYKFEVGTGLTNGAVTASGAELELTIENYLSVLTGGTLTAGGSIGNVQIANTNAISLNNNSAYLRVDLDCALKEGDVFKSTVSGNTVYVSKVTSRTNTATLPVGTLIQTPIPADLIGAKTLYLWKGGNVPQIQYFEITRPKQTLITLDATGAYNKYTTSVVAIYGEAMPEISTLPIKTGFVFGGYYDAPNGTGTQYYNGLGVSMRNWDKDVTTATLYAYWVEPCNMAPTLEKIVPEVTIWDGKEVDIALVRLTCDYDTTGIHYSLQSASEAIPGCTFSYSDERIYIEGTPSLSNASTVTKTITFTMTNDCSPASTFTVDATIRIYPASRKARIAYIVTGTKGGGFNDYSTGNESSSATLLTYLRTFYTVDCVNGYATKDPTAIANFYKDYDLLIVTDYLETPEGYTNAIGTLIDKKPILSFEAYVAGENGTNWHIGSNPKDPSPKVKTMKILCAGHAIFGDAEGVDVINETDTTVQVLSSISGKGLQGFVINEAPDFIFLATARDADNNRDLIVCCERQVVFPARLLLYGINFNEMGNLSPAGRVVMHQMIEYLLMTDESKVADCSLVFDNHDGDHLWSNPGNWAPGYNIIPTPYHPTRIIAECHVDVDNAHAGSVKVNQGRDEHGHVIDGKLIVKPYGGLTIAGMVAKVNDTRYASPITIKAEDLLIEADATHNGSFVYGNKESDVNATVEYYSRGSGANTAGPVWQYIGIPFQAGQTAISMYYQAWMCRWEEGTTDNLGGLWQWVANEDVLLPFEGYCITQETAKTYTNVGKLNPPVTQTIVLDNRDADGFAFAANSWTAPIKIQEMQDADFNNVEHSIYIYHTGSYANWAASGEPVSAKDGSAVTLPGQYAVVPIHSSPYLSGADSVIPAMQGFFVKTTDVDATLDLVYNRVVYDAKYFKTSTQPMRAPRRAAANDAPEVMVLTVCGNEFGGDRVHILSRGDFSDNYEDGWDGRKLEGDSVAPKLAVVKQGGEMAVAAIESPEERYLTFRAGNDNQYTFTFNYEGEKIYLYDRVANQAAVIKTGNTYSFTADNKTAAQRFLITKNPPADVITSINSAEPDGICDKPEKIIYDGNLLILYRGEVYDAQGARVTEK